MPRPTETLADFMADYDRERIAEIERQERIDALPENAARIAAKRKAEFEKEVRQGLRDANGDWIITEAEEDDEDDDDESDE